MSGLFQVFIDESGASVLKPAAAGGGGGPSAATMRALNASVGAAVARSVEWVGGFLPDLTGAFTTARLLPPRNSTIVACNMAIGFTPNGSIRLTFRVGLTIVGQVVFTGSDTAGTVKTVDIAPGSTIAGLQSIEVFDSGISNTAAGHAHLFFGFA